MGQMPSSTAVLHRKEIEGHCLYLTTLLPDGSEEQSFLTGAIELASDVHAAQKPLRSGKPFIAHPLETAVRLADELDVKEDPVLLAAAVLHDSIEDQADTLAARAGITDPSLSRHERGYGALAHLCCKSVADIVLAVTNPETCEVPDKDAVLVAYHAHMEGVVTKPEAATVKLADFLGNLLSIGELDGRPDMQEKQAWLAKKYGPVCEMMGNSVMRGVVRLAPEVKEHVQQTLSHGYQLAQTTLQRLAPSDLSTAKPYAQ